MGLGFQIDVINDTPVAIALSSGPSTMAAGGFIPNVTLQPGQAMSQVSTALTPQYFELSGDTGNFAINLQLADGSESPPPQGVVIIEFDGTSLTNFRGIVFYGSKGDFTPMKLPNNAGYVYATIFLGTWGQWTLGTVVLLVGGKTF
jgi:hypothetical protein